MTNENSKRTAGWAIKQAVKAIRGTTANATHHGEDHYHITKGGTIIDTVKGVETYYARQAQIRYAVAMRSTCYGCVGEKVTGITASNWKDAVRKTVAKRKRSNSTRNNTPFLDL